MAESDGTVPVALRKFFEDNPRPALAFSGGSDSSYLFYAAVECGADVTAYHAKSQFLPLFETEDALKTAGILGRDLHILLLDSLSDPRITANGADRCYLCKNQIFSAIIERARSDKKECVIDATNASDDPRERPGMRALEELGVLSPLRICGITKQQVRELSRRAGLWTWDMPSNSCLATRISSGIPITSDGLERTEKAEDELRALGFSDFRVRTTADGARLETTEDQTDLLDSKRADVEKILLKYYPTVSYGNRKPAI